MVFYKTNAVIKFESFEIEVAIKLEQNTRTFEAEGLDNLRNFYTGNVVNSGTDTPWLLPSQIQNGSTATITIDEIIEGNFIFQNIHRTRFKQIEKKFGQTFKGVLIPKKTYNPSDWS